MQIGVHFFVKIQTIYTISFMIINMNSCSEHNQSNELNSNKQMSTVIKRLDKGNSATGSNEYESLTWI